MDVATKVKKFFDPYKIYSVSEGEALIQAGEEPRAVYYLVKGRVGQFDITPKGYKITLNIFKPGAFFPMSWAINQTPNKYFFECLDDVSYKKAPAEAVLAFMKDNADVTFDLLSRLYRGAEGLMARMAYLMGASAKDRLIFELELERQRFSQKINGQQWLLDVKETELAARTGLTRETVNRELSKLKARHLIEVTPKGIVIKELSEYLF